MEDLPARMLEVITGGSTDVVRVPRVIKRHLKDRAGCAPDAILAEVALVAAAASQAPGAPWADEFRAEGWGGKRDWSKKPSAILNPEKWAERLAAARAWEAAGAPSCKHGPFDEQGGAPLESSELSDEAYWHEICRDNGEHALDILTHEQLLRAQQYARECGLPMPLWLERVHLRKVAK